MHLSVSKVLIKLKYFDDFEIFFFKATGRILNQT